MYQAIDLSESFPFSEPLILGTLKLIFTDISKELLQTNPACPYGNSDIHFPSSFELVDSRIVHTILVLIEIIMEISSIP